MKSLSNCKRGKLEICQSRKICISNMFAVKRVDFAGNYY